MNSPHQRKDFEYLHVKVHDMNEEDILAHFEESNKFIGEALAQSKDNKVLVHCGAGLSRSASLCLAYMMVAEPSWDFKKAWAMGK